MSYTHHALDDKPGGAVTAERHGDTSVAIAACGTVGGMSLARIGDVLGIRKAMLAEAEQDARKVGTEIVRVRGYTNYAIAMAVEMIVDSIVNERSSVFPVSVLLGDFRGVSPDVFLSLPCVISRRGVQQRLLPELDDNERELLRRSAAAMRAVIQKTEVLARVPVRPDLRAAVPSTAGGSRHETEHRPYPFGQEA